MKIHKIHFLWPKNKKPAEFMFLKFNFETTSTSFIRTFNIQKIFYLNFLGVDAVHHKHRQTEIRIEISEFGSSV